MENTQSDFSQGIKNIYASYTAQQIPINSVLYAAQQE